MIKVIEGFDEQIGTVERDLRRFSRRDSRCLALQTIYGVGAILSCHLLAEIGEATRFKRSRQLVRASGLDPTVLESADTKRRGRLSKQGSPHLRWALVQAGNQAVRTTSPTAPSTPPSPPVAALAEPSSPLPARSPDAPTTSSPPSKPRTSTR